jgi:A/G-specific adenine glycosylase
MTKAVKNYPPADISAKEIASFRRTVYRYYRTHVRSMPWRDNTSPYYIFVSEVMLQQTQLERVIKKFPLFIERYRSFSELAGGSLAEIFSVWQGLGYNRRAKWLRDAARMIMETFHGVLPEDPEQIAKLPGIGKNTAAAIAAYSFNHPVAYIETNIRSVFIHHFFHDSSEITDEQILPIVQRACDKKNPREWYWALMDYGTHLKETHKNPSRKSAHYRPQTPFKNSDRRIRGIIIKTIGDNGTIAKNALYTATEEIPERIDRIVDSLVKEGLVREEAGTYRIGD